MTQEVRRHPQTEDSSQTESQPHPAHRIDRLGEQGPGEKRNHQGLGVDQHRAEAGSGLLQTSGQHRLKQAGIHQGEEAEPAQVPRIDPQGTT